MTDPRLIAVSQIQNARDNALEAWRALEEAKRLVKRLEESHGRALQAVENAKEMAKAVGVG